MTHSTTSYDLFIIGGGIHGTAIARDAAGRGLSVCLCEQGDLASATSSASTKLIHGGLRYLEYGNFRLVREALQEREVMLKSAPHIIKPLQFILPHSPDLRPIWMIRLGLFLYDLLAGEKKSFPQSEFLNLRNHTAGQPLKPSFQKGFSYFDGWVEDSRLVVLNAMDAKERDASILTRTRFVSAERGEGCWKIVLESLSDPKWIEVTAKVLVNAAGPWVQKILQDHLNLPIRHPVRLIKGSHIVVPRLYEGDHAYIFQNEDRRIVFAIPYEGNYTLIGTTDVNYTGDPSAVKIAPEEIQYLCNAVSKYFTKPVKPEEVLWSYSGVRSLVDDGSQKARVVTRDYVLDIETSAGAHVLSIIGGKLTTARILAEKAVGQLSSFFPKMGPSWTKKAVFPGGDLPEADRQIFVSFLKDKYPWLSSPLTERYVRTYGTRTLQFLGSASSLSDLGSCIAGDVYEAELRYSQAHEFTKTGEDFLWRRTKLGLHLSGKERERVERWFS